MGRCLRKPSWYVADVEGLREVRPPRSVRVWSPSRLVFDLVDGEFSERREEIFPGYLLFGIVGGGYDRARNMVGVRLLSTTPLSQAEVDGIRKMERLSTFRSPAGFARGERCTISDDARNSYSGFPCVFESVVPMNGGFYAKVEVDLYGERVFAWVPLDHLEGA